MKNKLLLIITLCFTLFVTGCNKQEENIDSLSTILQRGKIIVGVKYDTKPFGYMTENQQLVGFDVDLAKSIAKSILGDENKVEFKQVTPSNRILALSSGQVDMIIATMTVTEQRSEIIDFSTPYYVTGQAILVPRGSKITSISDLNGKRVIIIFGSTAEKNLRLAAPEAQILGFKTYTSAYSALKQNRADAITSDETILLGFAMEDKNLKLLPKKYSKEPYAIGFKKGPSSIRLRNRVNFVLNDMIQNGELAKLKSRWIKY